MKITAVDWGLLGFLSILWGGTFFFTSIAVGERLTCHASDTGQRNTTRDWVSG